MKLSVWFLPAVLLSGFCASAAAQPFYDDCATPIQIINFPQDIPYDTSTATTSVGLSACANFGEDLWYMAIAPFDGLFSVSHNFNPTQHAVYILPPGFTCPTDAEQLYCDSPSNQNASLTPAISGLTYLVRLSAFQGGGVSGILTIDFLEPPINDDCASPTTLNLPDVVAYDGTGSSGTPGLTCNVNRDIWYEVTPTLDGLISVDANPNNQSTAFAVDVAIYTAPGPGVCPTDADEVSCAGTDSVSFAALSGTSYLIRVGYPFGNAFASALLSVSQTFAPPANDDCTTAEVVAIPSSTMFDTTGATPDNTGLFCALNDDLWYLLTAPADGQIQTELGGGFSLQHQYYHLPLGAGTCPTDFDAASPCWNVTESWTDVVAGELYVLRIGQSQTGPTAGTIDLEFIPAISNDECTAPVPLAIPSTSIVTTLGSTPDTTGLQSCADNGDTWYSLVIPSTGLLHLLFDEFVTMGLYTNIGACPSDADLVFCDDEFEALVPVTAGQQLFLRLSTFNAFPPVTANLVLEVLLPAANDDCASGGPTPVTVPTALPVAWDNLTGSDDSNGLSCDVRRDLWYSFVPTQDGCVEFFNDSMARYAVYPAPGAGGCPLDPDLICYNPIFNQANRFDFPVLAGQEYLIRVGSNGNAQQSGNFTLSYVLCDPINVVCDDTISGQVTASFDVPPGTTYDSGVEVRVNGVFAATLPSGQTTYTELLPGGFAGVVQMSFTGLSSTLGTSDEITCASAIGAVPNNLCSTALPVGLGNTPLDNSIAIVDPAVPLNCTSIFTTATSDIWFSFTPAVDQQFTVSICNASFSSRLEVFDGTGGCPTSGGLIQCTFGACSLSFLGTTGVPYLIRVVALDNGVGFGDLNIVADCPQLSGLTCNYNCTSGELELSWTGGQHDSYDISSSVGVIATGLTTDSFLITNPAPGAQIYEVTGFCPNGSSTTGQCSAFVADLANPSANLVIALESFNFTGTAGGIDSGEVIANVLDALGQDVSVLSVPDFDQFPCLDPLTNAAQNIWVALGTYPFNYVLSVDEGNLLAQLAVDGRSIYLEGGDHWGANQGTSLLNDRDGVEPDLFGNIDNGDDSFTAMTGLNSGIVGGNFSLFGTVNYFQDNTLGDDRTDRLIVSGTDTTGQIPPDPFVTAGAIFANSDDTLSGEPPYVTAIVATHADGGRMISSSFEFGGYGGDLIGLMQGYLSYLTNAPPTGTMFRRGDTNGDNSINIADAIYLLGNLFPTGAPNVIGCLDSADANNDGSVNIADAIFILGALFVAQSTPIPAPSPECGTALDAPVQTGLPCDVETCP